MRRRIHRWYRRTYAFLRFLDRRVTPAGAFFFTMFLIALFFGINTRTSTVFTILAPLLAVLFVSLLLDRRFRPTLSVRRILPRYAAVGMPLLYRIEVRNDGSRGEAGLRLVEEPQDPRPDYETWSAVAEPGEGRRNAFDRFMRYYRWEWLIERRRGAIFEPSEAPALAPGETRSVDARLTPTRRGVIRFAGCRVERDDLFGLWKRSVVLPDEETIIALPPVHPVNVPEFCGHRRYHHGGVIAAHKVGESEEFMQVREYRPGDPLKRIHWPSSARIGALAVKEFQDEYYARIALVLDTFHPAAVSPELEDAVSIAASYLVAGVAEDEIVDLLFVGAKAFSFPTGRGIGSTARMLEILAGVEPCRDRKFGLLAGLVRERIPLICGALVVLLGLDDARVALLRMLGAAGVELRIFLVSDDPDAARRQIAAAGLDGVRVVEVGKAAEALRAG